MDLIHHALALSHAFFQTIGYGDIHPESDIAKVFCVLYLPLAVVALADAVADIGMINVRRGIRETDFGRVADESLLRDAVRNLKEGDKPNFQPVLTESEFIVDQLLAENLVDSDAVIAIKQQFAYLTRNAKVASGEERTLTTKLVFEEIRERAHRGVNGLLSPGAEALDIMQDEETCCVSFKWANYEDWMSNSWRCRVLAKIDEPNHVDQENKQGTGLKHLNINSFRMM
jgi:hypothetical protein